MGLHFAIMSVFMILILVPARIFIEMGLDPEKMTIIPFLLAWVVIFSAVKYLMKAVFLGARFVFRSFKKWHKLQKAHHRARPHHR